VLLSNVCNTKWSYIDKRRKKYPQTSEDLTQEIQQWVCIYDDIIHSPINDDTIVVVDETTGKKRVSKLLLRCSIRELHNGIMKDVNEGGLLNVWNDNTLLTRRFIYKCSHDKDA